MNAFDGLISKLNTAKERKNELQRKPIKTSKTEKQREKMEQITKNCGIITEGITQLEWEYQKEKKEKNRVSVWNDEKNFEIGVI